MLKGCLLLLFSLFSGEIYRKRNSRVAINVWSCFAFLMFYGRSKGRQRFEKSHEIFQWSFKDILLVFRPRIKVANRSTLFQSLVNLLVSRWGMCGNMIPKAFFPQHNSLNIWFALFFMGKLKIYSKCIDDHFVCPRLIVWFIFVETIFYFYFCGCFVKTSKTNDEIKNYASRHVAAPKKFAFGHPGRLNKPKSFHRSF